MKFKRAKVTAKSLVSRLGGFSLFGVGVSFKTSEPERQVVREVITALEDKRALYVGAVHEQPQHVVASILDIRKELTDGLKRVSDSSPAKQSFRIMRAACREFLNNPAMQGNENAMLHNRGLWQQEEFLIGLGKLRSTFGQQLAMLGYLYNIDIEEQLAATLPPLPEGED